MTTYQTTFNVTAASAALKELYTDQVVQNMVYSDNPWLAMIPKNTDFGGKYKPIPIISTTSQGRSALFATAQANQTAPLVESFLLTRTNDYSIATISNELILAAKTDKMAFINGAKLNVDAAIRAITLSLANALFRNGTGTLARISDITTGVITLTNAADVVHFEVNQVLRAATGDGSGLRATYKGYVIAVNRTAGTVTVANDTYGGSAATPTNWTNTDYLSVDGDYNAKLMGLSGWIPAAAPGATAFYGVDRSIDPTRLGGVRHDGSAQTIEEALIDASNLVAREGGKPKLCITNFASYSALEKSLGSKVQYIDVKGPADIGFRGMRVAGANTQIDVFPDRSCQSLTAWLLQPDTWALESLGDAPMILKYGDGMEMLRVYNADSAELRCGYYANVSCNAPGWNANVTLSA